MERIVPLIETVEDIESLATEEKTDFYEFNESGETEKNLLSHSSLSSDDEEEEDNAFELSAGMDVLSQMKE
jgi:hypothetical protein